MDLPQWFLPSSTSFEVAAALTTVLQTYTSDNSYLYNSVREFNSMNSAVCSSNTITETLFSLQKTTALITTISFYANLISGGSLYFRTKQVLSCDCSTAHLQSQVKSLTCNGTFRLSFDGEVSNSLLSWGNSGITTALRSMKTMIAGGITVVDDSSSSSAVCVLHHITNYSIVLHAQFGNIPQLQLWSSVTLGSHSSSNYDTGNTSNVLTLETSSNGNNVVVCNGIGSCDYSTSTCICPYVSSLLGSTKDFCIEIIFA